MEPWQVSHIQKHKYKLQKLTICNSSFRAILQEHGVLDESDISLMDAMQTFKGTHSESELLYNLLLTRRGAFSAMIDACNKTKQTGALQILKQGSLESIKSYVTSWDELSDDLKNEMGNKRVDIQGKTVKLSECCNRFLHLIDRKLLIELLKGNIPTLVNNQVPDQVEYYIHRTLRSRNKLKSSVFQQACNDVFVVEGMERYQLTSLVAGAETDVSGNQIECLTVRFILLEYENDFESICKLSSSPVHLIRYNDSIYEWIQSSGSVKSLHKYVDDNQDCFIENELASKRNRVNVIPDSPGMGKTVLLANVAHQISKDKPNILIRFIVINDLVQVMSKNPINLESVVSLIAEQSSEFECGRGIVKQKLTFEPCILMFDGFDEVPLHQVATAKQILKTIMTLKSAQVFVTTRPHMRNELENTLQVLGYTIKPFTEADQVEFLLKFWKMKGAKINDNLKKFAKICVNAISSNMTDFERDIAGIPLQCRLLAETYTKQAVRCSEMGVPDINSQPIGQINSIYEMYERHMKMRLESKKEQVKAIKNVHTYYALELLFPEHAQQFETLKTSSISLNELCAVGFLEATNSDDIRFVHRTFAEFFVAWFAVEMKMTEKFLSFLLNQVLATKTRKEFITTPFGRADLGTSFTFNHPVITYFINGFTKMLAKNHGDLNQIKYLSMLVDSHFYGQVSHIFVASAVSDYQYVPLAVSLCFDLSPLVEEGDSDVCELLLISAKHSSVALMKTFCTQRDVNNLSHSKNSFALTPLHVAVQRGNYNLVEFLARKFVPQLNNVRYLLHFCVFESLSETNQIIRHKIQIIKLLSKKSSNWIDEKLPDGTVPLLQKNVNIELLKCLIECGADVNYLDKNENTILHKVTENPVTPEFYHWLVVSLSKRKFKHFNHPNCKNVFPLHCALGHVEVLPDTLKYFRSNGADFNALDSDVESPIFYAIRGGRSVPIIRALIGFSPNWKKNKHGETLLHISAKHGHYYAMKYFLETLKIDVNARDKLDNTPLHFAVMRRSTDYESMQQLLITCGADVNATNRESHQYTTQKGPFGKALRVGKGLTLNIIMLMEEHGLSIEASEALEDLLTNRNIMSWEFDKEFVEVLEFLIRKGGQIKAVKDNDRYSMKKDVNVWESEGVQRNMRAIIQATDMSYMWTHLKSSKLLTESELEDIQHLSTDSFNKCERFYQAVQTKKGSFEQVCILMIASKQMSSLSLLRQSLYLALRSYNHMFVTPPTFTNQFINSQQNSNFNTMALITRNPYLTIWRFRDTIGESVVVIKEADISSLLQKTVHEDLVVVKLRVVTEQLIGRLEASGVAECKIIFVCSQVSEDVENCQAATDSFSTWNDISSRYFKRKAMFNIFRGPYDVMNTFFKSPLMLSNLSQLQWILGFPQKQYSVMGFKAGHIKMEFKLESYLCPTIFHYFMLDKLVFQGIPIEKLKEYTIFGHKIGYFGENDVDNLDFVVVKQSHQFDEICMQTSENVHLIEYEQEKGDFKLLRTWGWEENIQRFLKKPLCEGFPHCDCAPANEDLLVRLLIESEDHFRSVHRFECILPIQDLTPITQTSMKLKDAEDLFNIKALLKHFGEQQEVEHTDFFIKSHSEQIVKLVTEQLSTYLVESELYQVAINTLFPPLTNLTNVIWGFEKYQQLEMLKSTDKNLLVFVHKSLAWYFIAKLLLGLPETAEFEEITSALRRRVFQNCFEPHKVMTSTGSYVRVNPSKDLSSYEFINIMCFRFIDALLKNNYDNKNASIGSVLKNFIAADPEGFKWVHASVNANLFHLLQLIISLEINSLAIAFETEEIVVLAINHADVTMTRLVTEQFQREKIRKLTEINIYLGSDETSMMSLAALRGNYGLVKYLLNKHGFKSQLQKHDKLREVALYCVTNTNNNSYHAVYKKKCIVNLLLRTDMTFIKHIQLSSNDIHVDLITFLIKIGVDVHAENNKFVLHCCPRYLTSQEYHKVVKLIYAKFKTSLARLFQDFDKNGETAFHVAVEHLELLDETLSLFSDAGFNFNILNKDGNSVFVHAAKHFRSARVLDALYRFGAEIHARDKDGQPASVYCRLNKTALRYLSSRGVKVYDAEKKSVKAHHRATQ